MKHEDVLAVFKELGLEVEHGGVSLNADCRVEAASCGCVRVQDPKDRECVLLPVASRLDVKLLVEILQRGARSQADVRTRALAKLTAEEREALGLE